MDVVEFYWVCRALGTDAETVFSDLSEAIRSIVIVGEDPKPRLPRMAQSRVKPGRPR